MDGGSGISKFTAGQPLTATDLNKIVDILIRRVVAGPGISISIIGNKICVQNTAIKHIPTGGTTILSDVAPQPVGTANAAGDGTKASRDDHVHSHVTKKFGERLLFTAAPYDDISHFD